MSPLRKLHQQAEASLIAYGPVEEDRLVAETFGELELEYAAIRKSCILLDLPQRAVIEVTGPDRIDFLNRMITQELRGLEAFSTRRSFWLNRKGRIDADLRVIELGTRTLLDVDALAAMRAVKGLRPFVVMEDVEFVDASESIHRLALHGPSGPALLAAVSQRVDGPPVETLAQGAAAIVSIKGHQVIVDRDDSTADVGLELFVPAMATMDVYQQLLEAGQGTDDPSASPFRLRPSGWAAYNIARIEAGRPLYNIDFGSNSLPHETGVIQDRVSFKKGCYLGQEVVARMESRGHSKQLLMAIKCEVSRPMESDEPGPPRLPVTGSHVWLNDSPESDAVGVVTSSTLSPMLGQTPICFAPIKHDHAKPENKVLVATEDQRIRGELQSSLVFWKHP